ncbi:conserved hypothetical protein [Verticillium alfalfae VaMs.102]|uniref:Amine oxidase n=1 Tax=Verticillium alfalfae (strain VaMs.102 / ATCC MYA-4576 / FGSC 10136) TaxID=526221 RepID=C9SY65_VERA1|nr:conserved hypothetical protein [Verticillium alfalfae VaMs.102]EEY23730.1 conserved hypothetical protein [Verticillium alfalfae VaMs.102]
MRLSPIIAWPLWLGSVSATPSKAIGGHNGRPDLGCKAKAVYVDVAIIGGGSGGIHAAIQLKDAGAKVLVIEKKNQIGGHAETYKNNETGIVSNVGVVLFENTDLVKRYFNRLKVPITTSNVLATTSASRQFDFALGFPIPAQSASAAAAQQQVLQAAAQAYTQNVLSKYGWIDQGFLVPDPVPTELYEPFGQFAAKYNFSALLPVIAQFNWYTGNLTTLPALYGIKGLGPGLLSSLFGEFILSGTGDTRSLYDSALNELGSNVLLSTTILNVDRHSNATGVTLVVVESGKSPKTIIAQKLLLAIPPTLKNMIAFDLSIQEKEIFSKFSSLGYFAGVASVPGFNGSFTNIGALTPFNQPIIPGNNGFGSTGSPNEFLIGGGFDTGDVTDEDGKNLVRKNLATLAAAGVVPADAASNVTFPYTSNHTPYNVRCKAEDIKNGFYRKLVDLQGSGNTYFTGAAFAGHNSALIWNWNQGTIVPAITKALGLKYDA